jgi:hypothetical protein
MSGTRTEIAIINDAAPKFDEKRIPDDFETEGQYCAHIRERYAAGYSFNEANINAGRDDAKFVVGQQWDQIVEQNRIAGRKPVLTFNHLIAYVAQVVGNRLANETEIRVYPEKNGTKPIAEIREGLIRAIYKNSQADFARDEAAKYQVIGGEGYFALGVEYVADDVFEQEIKINPVSDPYAVVLDPLSIEPSGEDAEWGFITEDIPTASFKKRWPKQAAVDFESINNWNSSGFWATEDTTRIAQYWSMVTEGTKLLALYQDGTVHDVSDKEEWEYLELVALRKDGTPYIREVPNRFARRYLVSGASILEGPHDYPMSSIPIYRVPGWELRVDNTVYRWGVVRFLKDPARMNNLVRSIQTEQAMNAPRNKWLTTPAAVQGHEQRWRNAAVSDDPLLYYNDDAQAPIRQEPPALDGQLQMMSAQLQQDLKDISNLHEASMGMPSNEVSKVAIQQRQMVGDVGTFIYNDRRRLAEARCAKNINELIPYIYDTQRIVTVIGPDSKEVIATINDPSDPNSDVTVGKYGVKVSMGPASETKRALAGEQMMSLINAFPDIVRVAGDLIVEAQDWPKASEIARRLRTQMPAGIISPDEMTPEMQQAQQQQAQMAEMQMQLDQALKQAEIADLQTKAANQEARARLAEAQAYKAQMDADARMLDVQSKTGERLAKRENADEELFIKALDQENKIVAEDRDFELRRSAADRAVVNPQENASE